MISISYPINIQRDLKVYVDDEQLQRQAQDAADNWLAENANALNLRAITITRELLNKQLEDIVLKQLTKRIETVINTTVTDTIIRKAIRSELKKAAKLAVEETLQADIKDPPPMNSGKAVDMDGAEVVEIG